MNLTSTASDDTASETQTSTFSQWFDSNVNMCRSSSCFETRNSKGGVLEREARRISRWPKTFFWVSFCLAVALSGFGLYYGGFSVTVDNAGWRSRGTLIANRQVQLELVRKNRHELGKAKEEAWGDLTSNIQRSFARNDRRRQLASSFSSLTSAVITGEDKSLLQQLSFHEDEMPIISRRLKEDNGTIWDTCDLNIYSDPEFPKQGRLWPVWKTKRSSDSAMDPEVLRDLCNAEESTQRVLIEKGLCFGCDDGGCLPPYSIVTYARMVVKGGFTMDCEDLAEAWEPHQGRIERIWKECVDHLMSNDKNTSIIDPCPRMFTGALVDGMFQSSGKVEYTSSVFVTREDMISELYDASASGAFDRGGSLIEGVYDTQKEDFVTLYANNIIQTDMLLAIGSAVITTAAMLVHTRSPFLTFIGLIQIVLSFPLAFFIYRFVGQIHFFPFLNFIGIFVVFALGADHLFVAVDKWKNARRTHPDATTEMIAAISLPEASRAMFLTSITTAVAFWSTAITPVAPIKVFAIFCGLLIMFDYILDVFLVFPCLCIYDKHRNNQSFLFDLSCKRRSDSNGGNTGQGDFEHGIELKNTPLIRRILLKYYEAVHYVRWPLFAGSMVMLGLCAYYASTIELPESADVRVLKPSAEYEIAHRWRSELLINTLGQQQGGRGYVIWGVKAADNGDLKDPEKVSSLVLDETFDPSTKAAQIYLRDFCDNFFAEEFATPMYDGFTCPINRFDNWLKEQSINTTESIYTNHCNSAVGIPMDKEAFHSCLSAWQQKTGDTFILTRRNIVKIIHFPFWSTARYDSPFEKLRSEWNIIEDWMQKNKLEAPLGVSNAFFSSLDFWWYDTNRSLVKAAKEAVIIALGCSALVILISSRSLTMTLFSVVSIAYVLASVTALMVFFGWTLGFLECICFAILIGVSVDFVMHFCHAYTELPGNIDREERTKFALLNMGPSILAAAFTTLAGATIMLFTVILFFRLFATVLFFSLLQAVVGSFVVFLVLTDCIGPSNPTLLLDKAMARFRNANSETESEKCDFTRARTETSCSGISDYQDSVVDTYVFPATECEPISASKGWDIIQSDEIEV